MLNGKGFDLWADDYDKVVGLSDEDNSYPFAGYKNILNEIYKLILDSSGKDILDLGFGTATLASKLYEKGFNIYGQDFSDRMIEIARKKMPQAKLFKGDFRDGLVEGLRDQKYHAIVATYSLHHLKDLDKVTLIKNLLTRLKNGGKLYIGDVAFKSRKDHDMCKHEAGDMWDDDEIYFVTDELKPYFKDMKFKKFSECSGLITIKNNKNLRNL